MHLSKTICSIAATLLLSLPSTLATNNGTYDLDAAGNWTAIDGSGVQAAPGYFTFTLLSASDSPLNQFTLTVWTQTTPVAQSQQITMCSDSSEPWQGFVFNGLAYPIGLHNSAKWCGKSNSDGLWLSYYDQFQMDVSTSGVCDYLYTTSKLSWQCWLPLGPEAC